MIPAFIASGLITGIINLLKRPDIAGQLAVDYPNVLGLLAIFGSAVFAIMNILVGVNAARVFGGSQAMGGVMAGILQPGAGADHVVRRGVAAGARRGDRRAAGGGVDVLGGETPAHAAAGVGRTDP